MHTYVYITCVYIHVCIDMCIYAHIYTYVIHDICINNFVSIAEARSATHPKLQYNIPENLWTKELAMLVRGRGERSYLEVTAWLQFARAIPQAVLPLQSGAPEICQRCAEMSDRVVSHILFD